MKASEGGHCSKGETRLNLFLPDRTAHTPWGEDVGACAVLLAGQFPASPVPREPVHPEAAQVPQDTAGLSMVSLCAQMPLLALLSALELLNVLFWSTFLDTDDLYTSVNMDGAVDSLRAFRGSIFFTRIFYSQ